MPVPTENIHENCEFGRRSKVLTGLATLTKGEPRSEFGSSLVDEFANHLDVITGHDHFFSSVRSTLWPFEGNSDICCAQEELRAIFFHERSVSTTLLLGQNLEVRCQDRTDD